MTLCLLCQAEPLEAERLDQGGYAHSSLTAHLCVEAVSEILAAINTQ